MRELDENQKKKLKQYLKKNAKDNPLVSAVYSNER
jgi:hypothetical protein